VVDVNCPPPTPTSKGWDIYGVAFLTREGIMHGKESGRSAVGRGGNRWGR